MRIRAVSVFEGVVYHCWPVDLANPERIQLEVDALLRPGDADATAGPLLLSVADYIAMVGDLEVARSTLRELASNGRIVQHLTADYIAFPTWTPVADGDPGVGEGGSSESKDPDVVVAATEPAGDEPTAGDATHSNDDDETDSGRPGLRLVVDGSTSSPDT